MLLKTGISITNNTKAMEGSDVNMKWVGYLFLIILLIGEIFSLCFVNIWSQSR